jgi:hypothetical protein
MVVAIISPQIYSLSDLAQHYGHDHKNFEAEPFLAQKAGPPSPVSPLCSSKSALVTMRDNSCHPLIPAVANLEPCDTGLTDNTDESFIHLPKILAQSTAITINSPIVLTILSQPAPTK